MLAFSLFILAAIIGKVSAAVAADEVLSLPGWTGALPTKQFSGYLSISGGTNLHYWLVTAKTNPETAPTVIWFNGGPGCSSLDGFVYEHGPFVISKDLTLTERTYSWNTKANVLYIEAPVGVGFSYSDSKNYKCDDDRTATENRAAVEKFFALFPEYKSNKFFITGESYAGVYVPTLAEAIVQGQADGTYTGAKLTGIAVGNGCSGTEVGICGSGPQGTYYEWSYLAQSPFIDNALKAKIAQTCDWESAKANKANALTAKCVNLLDQASDEIQNVNLYDVYGDCVNSPNCVGAAADTVPRGKVPIRPTQFIADESGVPGAGRKLQRVIPYGPDACIDSAVASAWLNQVDVQAAIHVKKPANCWSVCGTAPSWSYTSTRTNLPQNTYPGLISNITVVIYNGDWDGNHIYLFTHTNHIYIILN